MNWFNRIRSYFIDKWWTPFDGFKPFGFWNVTPRFNNYGDDLAKLSVALSNPALLKVICLMADLGSLGKIYVYKDDKDYGAHPALDRLRNPNPMQSQSQILWDYALWNALGTANLYVDSDLVDKESNKMYFLMPQKMEYPVELERKADYLVFSKAKERELMDTKVRYRYADGNYIEIPLSKILILTDLTNGTGNWFKGNSKIDALTKIISNSEAALDSENINIRYAGKFMVAGTQDPKDVTALPLSEGEKKDVEQKIDDPGRQVTAVKSMIEIKRFVEDMRRLQLNEKYLAAFFLIGNMYNIPRDVLEAFTSSTFENQEKARGAMISYVLQPKYDDLMNSLGDKWGLTEQGLRLVISWDHLPFMQVFEKERATTAKTKAETFASLQKSGVSLAEINEFLDTNFTNVEKPKPATTQPTA